MNYKTPGVYIEEISLLPASVAPVATAIPAFIGYTETAMNSEGGSLLNVPTRITSMVDYRRFFGEAAAQPFTVTLSDTAPFLPLEATLGTATPYRMFHALEMYFGNGGGPCYIVSVGDYSGDTATPSLDAVDDFDELKGGLDAVKKVDEVTLLVIPEADRLGMADYHTLYQEMLAQCASNQDRFALFDVRSTGGETVTDFRNGIGTSFLKYGAAYYPYLKTSIAYHYTAAQVTFQHDAGANAFNGITMAAAAAYVDAQEIKSLADTVKADLDQIITDGKPGSNTKEEKEGYLADALAKVDALLPKIQNLADTWGDATSLTAVEDAVGEIETIRTGTHDTKAKLDTALDGLKTHTDTLLTEAGKAVTGIRDDGGLTGTTAPNVETYYTNAFATQVKAKLGEFRIELPPSSAIAGIYATVDRTRGVWKAPANVSLRYVSAPSIKISNDDQRDLNVHSTGKSINAIRAFSGKGILVWGARTLAGNDNEWRYVPVRRFYNMVEESVMKASEPFVFEPNDANTWTKIRAMIENFLTILWRQGALMGATPDDAYFVKIGLGETMTTQDVLEGRMIVEIGLAAVRPAEFIILRFSHKMQNN
ncbi:phage tail sheath family protein [Flavilitoribacter nigricans]|uniref:Tail sheath protein C-terminal domain-containing protein n=1 Tax=Flavilitoribacter nigricans (strain ATCC 23147 / DSM 23189 / NBRC 102662 / NCIMB 1420 / SS-2) TaxID=1122177 RepID=A0A2D0ND13_FLAN2|nr:phage tail sheath C-terminal domain-containing protein [Flavilitoribacter nigricans]PHN06367.1 hypothetical protein CRP01_12420 [Flavilitoribacter nigricans DSM 23189 = NBRC 102662]